MNDRQARLACLDYFRGMAILVVVVYHTLTASVISLYSTYPGHPLIQAPLLVIREIFNMGGLGVAIFFVISGFCIHLSYRRSGGGFRPFYIRRIFRIYPAYFVSLVLFAFLWPTSKWPADWFTSAAYWLNFISHLFLAHNFVPSAFLDINGIYWSLAIEFQLYLIFPLLLLMVGRMGWKRAMVVTAMIEVVSRLVLVVIQGASGLEMGPGRLSLIYLSPFSFWFSWSLGALLAEAHLEDRPVPFRHGPLPLWLWPILVWIFHRVPELSSFDFPVAALATARFLAHFLSTEDSPSSANVLQKGALRFLSFLGMISYSLYLLHLPFFSLSQRFEIHSHGSLLIRFAEFGYMALVLFLIVAASWLLYLMVEEPGIALGKRMIKRLRQRESNGPARSVETKSIPPAALK